MDPSAAYADCVTNEDVAERKHELRLARVARNYEIHGEMIEQYAKVVSGWAAGTRVTFMAPVPGEVRGQLYGAPPAVIDVVASYFSYDPGTRRLTFYKHDCEPAHGWHPWGKSVAPDGFFAMKIETACAHDVRLAA